MLLAGCQTHNDFYAYTDAECTARGYKPGTPAHRGCQHSLWGGGFMVTLPIK